MMFKSLQTLLFSVTLCAFSSHLKAQVFSTSISRGPVLEIYPEFPVSTGATRWSFGYYPQQNDTAAWNLVHGFPMTGIKFSYIDLGSEVLGNAMTLQYDFSKSKRLFERLTFNYGLALGVVYFDNPYDYATNELNIASGSRFAFVPELNLGLAYNVNRQFVAKTSFNFYHTSNGHAQLPNVGINVPAIELGVEYRLDERKVRKSIQLESQKRWHLNGRFSLGVNEFGGSTSPTNGPKNAIYLASLYASKRYSAKGFWQFGFDGYYNRGYHDFIISQDLDQISDLEDGFFDASAILMFVGHEYIYGHYGMVIQVGYNLHNPFLSYLINEIQSDGGNELKAKIPGKFGVKYYLKNPFLHSDENLYLGVFIKSNMSQADFLEAGLGWRL